MDSQNVLFESDLLAAFTGFKFMPKFYAITKNNLTPTLKLYSDHFDFRGGFRLKQSSYHNVEKIDVFTMLWTNAIVIHLNSTPRTFSANFVSKEQRVDCLRFFWCQGCSLSDAAIDLVNEGEA
ncbi:MAG: hypothetical protein AB8E87_02250 [Prochlorococcus sp.]